MILLLPLSEVVNLKGFSTPRIQGKFIVGNTTDAELEYHEITSACSLWSTLQVAVDDLTDFLRIQPFNELAQRICAQLQARIVELKRSPAN
jgi:hypothetical protein